ncbi:para-nitrobenzyl esterase [Novosphingobium sp. SG751A]|uniref:hypothetical protein n=1 Tax=Novosphingobium sp. SG751A TaxID=2587000 RepID=UPI001554B384|nr:hypothetical protein [Novosphingobium sp. SG751A]NOW48463.1 para-nitrobenzyl esterase [Novosphingobium sp. SG751A]
MRHLAYALAIALTAPVAGSAIAAAAPAYSTAGTTIGTLMANPQTKAVLVKYIPDVVNNGQISLANGMTLKAIQSYSGDALNDDVLAKIDGELAKIAKK